MSKLVIVESPTKAKTIGRFLGRGYKVESSFGHLRDLPKSKMGIDIEKDFQPHYVVSHDKQKQVTKLKAAASKAREIYFATDEDREGEAISWHLAKILKISNQQTKRIVFHEITKEAILNSLKEPRLINQNLVDAQQGRRILDRLVGYELSPFLWRKVAKGLSAGRVQSVAVRLIVEREREIENFHSQEYWYIKALVETDRGDKFEATLAKLNGKRLDKFHFIDQKSVTDAITEIKKADFIIKDIIEKLTQRHPLPPFTTSTLQQEANRRLGFSAKQTMVLAQQLYEGVKISASGATGLITYMRTDSLNLAEKFLQEAQTVITANYGADYHCKNFYKTKSKNAQDAHEAIRPTSAGHTPAEIKEYLDNRQFKLYQLIWQRAIASQMKPAKLNTVAIDIQADNYLFRSTGSQIKFPGFLTVYPIQVSENILPKLTQGQKLKTNNIFGEQKFTQPPARYSEAGLVKALEERGIGRPSTYAPIIATVISRHYVALEEKRLKPTDIGLLVTDVLVKHFPEIVDYNFTAAVEEKLDDIALGEIKWQRVIKDFYGPFKKNLIDKEETVKKKDLIEEQTDEQCEKCGAAMVIKVGRFGKFLACSNYPECKNTKNINENGEPEKPETLSEKCPDCGGQLEYKRSRFGKFIGCSNYPDCKYIKSIENKTGVKCPRCASGEIVARRSKRGRTFFGCNQYPRCDFSLWHKPTGETCPDCQSLLVYGPRQTTKCSNQECKYQPKEK